MKMLLRDRNITVTEDNKKFYRKDKKLTSYSFNCGYIEVYESTEEVPYFVSMAEPPFWTTKPKVKVNIEKNNCYMVRMYHDNIKELENLSSRECFDTLTEARKYCSKLFKDIETKTESLQKGK